MTVSWTQPGDGVAQPDGTTPAALFRSVNYLVGPDVTASVFIPDFELSTSKAREALPTVVPFADAVFNVSRAALLIGAMNPAMLTSPRDPNELLMEATEDKLHQAYRGPLMEPSACLITLMRANGFAAMVSGAGPCVLVLHNGDANSAIDAVAHEQLESGHWKVLHLATDTQGVQVARL